MTLRIKPGKDLSEVKLKGSVELDTGFLEDFRTGIKIYTPWCPPLKVEEAVRNVTGTITRVSAKRSSNRKLGRVRRYFGGMVMYLLVI